MLTGKRLRQYLAYTVLKRKAEPERKPMQKAKRATPRRGPERNEPYKAWIRTLACCGCGVEGRSEAAHVGTDGGMSMKASDRSCIPLCADCHTQRADSYHRIAGGRSGFEVRYGLRLAALVRRLNAERRKVTKAA
jgi:hypothetical protein